jgi:hypothetical protein
VRRLTRYFGTLLALCSLALCVAGVVFWWRSYGRIDALVGTGGGHYDVKSWRGQVMLTFTLHQPPPEGWEWRSVAAAKTHFGDDPLDAGYSHRLLGFAYESDTLGHGRRQWTEVAAAAPYWFVTLLLLVWPVTWLVRHTRRRRWSAAGRCPHCGYDLRASGDRCPECGAAVR